MLAIIGGTGLTELPGMAIAESRQASDALCERWGAASAAIQLGQLAGTEIAFLPRHGPNSPIPPHRVNYRANIAALAELGVTKIIAVNAVGGISDDLPPTTLCVPDQLIDYSWGRAHSYFDAQSDEAVYAEFAEPYSQGLRSKLLGAAAELDQAVVSQGCYAVTQGPRLETAAEIDRFERDGATLVGMTGMPEAVLARELSLEYACLAVVVNWAAGRGPDADKPGTGIHGQIKDYLARGMASATALLSKVASS